jgi:D-3-phosphoglycerate dehydrogenase
VSQLAIKQLGVAAGAFVGRPHLRQRVLDRYPDARIWDGPRIDDEDVLIEFLRGCDAAIVGREPITDRVLSALPELRVVSRFGAGYENIDFDALVRHDVRFGYEFGVNRLAVAELAVALMLSSLRWVPALNQLMRAGARPGQRDGRFLTGRVVGIHGCGNIGKEVVRLLEPFGCTILACDIVHDPAFTERYNVEPVPFDVLLERSEIVSIHLPLTRLTRGLYGAETLARLRRDAVLVNTARGEIVDEDALLECLEAGTIAAAGFDAWAVEPPTNDRLLNHPHMLATPHIGASTEETRILMCDASLRGVVNALPVDPARFAYESVGGAGTVGAGPAAG